MNENPLLGMVLNNRYRIEKELGRGGFGAVFLANDQQLMDRPVVIKILLDQGAADGWFKRKFSQEIEALTRIDHPGIVSVIDTGELPEGQPFMVQQFVEGKTLREAIVPGGMDLKRVARIIRKVGQALTAAHQKGIIHRDLKPDNIMLRMMPDGTEHATIIDFGIATVADFPEDIPEKTKITGTFTYMAPEQFDGKPSTASDIYALGIIAFEMLAGAPPSSGKPLFELMLMQKEGNWPRISELRPSVPQAAQALLLKALSRKIEDRFASASQFGDDFSRALVSTLMETGEIPVESLQANSQRSFQWAGLTIVGILVVALIAVAASVKSTTPPVTEKSETSSHLPTVSLPLPELAYTYWIEGEKSTGVKFQHSHEQTYDTGDRIAIEVEFSRDGYFYAISQAPELFNGLPVFSSLFPVKKTAGYLPKVRKGQIIRIPEGRRITLQRNQSLEYVWLIFSDVALPALDNVEPGMVQDSTVSRKIFDFIRPLRDREPLTEIDTTLNRTLIRSTDSVVVQRINLTNIR